MRHRRLAALVAIAAAMIFVITAGFSSHRQTMSKQKVAPTNVTQPITMPAQIQAHSRGMIADMNLETSLNYTNAKTDAIDMTMQTATNGGTAATQQVALAQPAEQQEPRPNLRT